jgi:hypothetical protein
MSMHLSRAKINPANIEKMNSGHRLSNEEIRLVGESEESRPKVMIDIRLNHSRIARN